MRELSISKRAAPAYVEAFRELLTKIARAAGATARQPMSMYLAGGAAVHFYTGARMTDDVDAVFDRRILIPADASVIYRDGDGRARTVYFDVNYNETFALMHEDAHDDALRLKLEGLNVVRVFVLQPVDLAVSKLARFSDVDRGDIMQLARDGLTTARALRERAMDALPGYVGNVKLVETTIMLACRDIDAALKR